MNILLVSWFCIQPKVNCRSNAKLREDSAEEGLDIVSDCIKFVRSQTNKLEDSGGSWDHYIVGHSLGGYTATCTTVALADTIERWLPLSRLWHRLRPSMIVISDILSAILASHQCDRSGMWKKVSMCGTENWTQYLIPPEQKRTFSVFDLSHNEPWALHTLPWNVFWQHKLQCVSSAKFFHYTLCQSSKAAKVHLYASTSSCAQTRICTLSSFCEALNNFSVSSLVSSICFSTFYDSRCCLWRCEFPVFIWPC